MQSPEDLVDAAVAALRGGDPPRLELELAAQDAKYAGGPHDIGPLKRPKWTGGPDGIGDFFPGGTANIVTYPAVEVALADADGANFSIDQHESDVTAIVVVRAWLRDANGGKLNRACYRWGTAIHNALCDPDEATGRGSGFGPDISVTRWSARWRYNLQTNERSEVTSAVLLVYQLDAPDIRP